MMFGWLQVALGIIERDRRSALLASFMQAYYFRNLFFMRRPDMVSGSHAKVSLIKESRYRQLQPV